MPLSVLFANHLKVTSKRRWWVHYPYMTEIGTCWRWWRFVLFFFFRQIGEPDSMDRRLCSACGSLNPTRVKFCLTCEAVLPLTADNLVNISSLLRKSLDSPPPPPLTSTHTASPNRVVVNCRICSRQNSLGARFCDWCGIQDPCEVDLASQLQSCSVCPKCFWQAPRDSHFCSQCGFGFAGASEISSACDFSLGKSSFIQWMKCLFIWGSCTPARLPG